MDHSEQKSALQQAWTYRIDAKASSEERFFKVLMVMAELDASIVMELIVVLFPR